MGEWGVALDGVYLSGGDAVQWLDILSSSACSAVGDPQVKGCLTGPPDGMGLPPLRTEDVTYPQRDGVRHFSDWYEPRIITLANVQVCPDGCVTCATAREKVQDIVNAWSRRCDDAELVIYTDCHGSTPASGGVSGPYGVVGRPRVAEVQWRQGKSKCAVLTLRFDSIDHRLLILDECGTPGSGGVCIGLTPAIATFCRSYPRCYDMCYSTDISTEGSGPVTGQVGGTLCVYPTITLVGTLTNPVVENISTGEFVGYDAVINSTDPTVIIDTYTGTATQGGASRTHLLTGDPRLLMNPGENVLRLSSFGPGDTGSATICWRPAVESG